MLSLQSWGQIIPSVYQAEQSLSLGAPGKGWFRGWWNVLWIRESAPVLKASPVLLIRQDRTSNQTNKPKCLKDPLYHPSLQESWNRSHPRVKIMVAKEHFPTFWRPLEKVPLWIINDSLTFLSPMLFLGGYIPDYLESPSLFNSFYFFSWTILASFHINSLFASSYVWAFLCLLLGL